MYYLCHSHVIIQMCVPINHPNQCAHTWTGLYTASHIWVQNFICSSSTCIQPLMTIALIFILNDLQLISVWKHQSVSAKKPASCKSQMDNIIERQTLLINSLNVLDSRQTRSCGMMKSDHWLTAIFTISPFLQLFSSVLKSSIESVAPFSAFRNNHTRTQWKASDTVLIPACIQRERQTFWHPFSVTDTNWSVIDRHLAQEVLLACSTFV